jgi:hypothetical protein
LERQRRHRHTIPASGNSPSERSALDRTDGGIDGQSETNQTAELPPQFRRQLVDSITAEPAGTIIIDTRTRFSIWCWATAKRCVAALASAGKGSPGRALSDSAA